MLSDNIRNYRKQNNLSQDELAEKLGVSRQSVSFWETGQTQPTIDNIVALAKVFNVSTDMILGNSDSTGAPQDKHPENKPPKKQKSNIGIIIAICAAAVVLIGIVIAIFVGIGANSADKDNGDTSASSSDNIAGGSETSDTAATSDSSATTSDAATTGDSSATTSDAAETTDGAGNSASVGTGNVEFDLFNYCKNFAIEKGVLNGDYCIYQQPSAKYGGYANEYFSISYWSGSNMVEFCLHCPLDDTLSHNFYIRMRGGYNGTYEYVSSKYYRDTGESLREASGYIDPSVFSESYPLPFDEYIGSVDGQTDFMEQSRVGICDLIRCLEKFVEVEGMECDFSDFDFIKF